MPPKPNTCADCGVTIAHDAVRCRSCATTKRHADARAALTPPNPSGKCFCGCGGTTPIAPATRLRVGHVRGEHVRWIMGHQSRKEPREDTGGAEWIERDCGHCSPCWVWQGYRNADGYGLVSRLGERRNVRAHRLVYERMNGPIPEGLVLDHLCRNPACVNPAHLEPVTVAENVRRGNRWG